MGTSSGRHDGALMSHAAESTGTHALPQASPMSHQGPPAAPPQHPKIVSMALAIALAAVSGAGSGYATSAARDTADSARVDQRVSELERRVTHVERAEDGRDSLREELARLTARVDAWRQSDLSIQSQRDERLRRIEDAIYGRGARGGR